jgi:hypothetical protein
MIRRTLLPAVPVSGDDSFSVRQARVHLMDSRSPEVK